MTNKYFNFPVALISSLFNSKRKVLDEICNYSLYAFSLNIKCEQQEYDKFLEAAKYFDVPLTGNEEEKYKSGKELYSRYALSPKTGLNTSVFWDFYKNYKSDYDLACLAAYLSIKSIIGTKPYCKITNLHLWSRMCGYPSQVKDLSGLSANVHRYANEYQTKKIKKTLVQSWNLVTYARYTRGFYVSFNMSLEDLISQAKKRKGLKLNQ